MVTLKFNRYEFAGAFGDIGTFFPIVASLILINGVDVRNLLLTFGVLYIYSGVIFKTCIPVQPMKSIATVMIAMGLHGSLTTYSALVIGVIFFVFAITNSIGYLQKLIHKNVVHGIQLGLALNLTWLALTFMHLDLLEGLSISVIGVLVVVLLSRRSVFPPAFALIAVGFGMSIFKSVVAFSPLNVISSSFLIPTLPVNPLETSLTLVIPQIPLTIGNAIFATALLSKDLFPNNNSVTVRRLTFSHAFMNIVSGLLGGIAVCHGAGGLAGHYKFGARTGTAVVLMGGILVVVGLFFSEVFTQFLYLFPFSILGVFLLFSSWQLFKTVKRNLTLKKSDLFVILFVAIISVSIRYGYLIGFVGGILISGYFRQKEARRISKRL